MRSQHRRGDRGERGGKAAKLSGQGRLNVQSQANSSGRLARIDALRTLAMLWMTAYHFCFDLNHFGLTARQNFYADPFWTWQRTAIVSLFLFTAGLSQAVALHTQGLLALPAWQRLDARFWRRCGQVAACALLVSAGSYAMFPGSYIYFGVLHALALMLIIARLTAGWGRWLWGAGAGLIAINEVAKKLIFDSGEAIFLDEKWFNWLGIITRKPVTEDYVPLLPWLAVLWLGLAAGQWVLQHRPHWLGMQPAQRGASGAEWLDCLALPGRWSLSYYMLHQPVLIGLLMAWQSLVR